MNLLTENDWKQVGGALARREPISFQRTAAWAGVTVHVSVEPADDAWPVPMVVCVRMVGPGGRIHHHMALKELVRR